MFVPLCVYLQGIFRVCGVGEGRQRRIRPGRRGGAGGQRGRFMTTHHFRLVLFFVAPGRSIHCTYVWGWCFAAAAWSDAVHRLLRATCCLGCLSLVLFLLLLFYVASS